MPWTFDFHLLLKLAIFALCFLVLISYCLEIVEIFLFGFYKFYFYFWINHLFHRCFDAHLRGKGQCTCATHEGSNFLIPFHPHFWLRGLSSSMNHSRPLSLFFFTNFDLVDACDHGLDSSYHAHSCCAIGPSLWTFYGSDLLWFHLLSCNTPLNLEWHLIAYSTWWQ